ncbi:histidine kinase [Streptomyces sp. NPDC020298]|uniref:sensor histidine kinase n=1 Tax=unclassified Streptomyces TaxID=2593676 RepID=UPI0033FCEEC6
MTDNRGVGGLRGAVAVLTRRTATLPRLTRRTALFDAALALALAVAATDYALGAGVGRSYVVVDGVLRARTGADSWAGAVGPALLATLPLALRGRYPLSVLWVVIGAGLLAPDGEARIIFYAFVVAAYSAVAHSPYRAATLLSLAPALLVLAATGDAGVPTIPNAYMPLLVLVPLTATGYGMRNWRARAEERQTRMAELERERERELRRAVERERARIARELHDVVTHNVSVMIIQAGAARKVLDAAPDRTHEALLAIEAGGRAAMTELRHVMGLLTMDSEDSEDAGDSGQEGAAAPAAGTDLAPPPGLARLESLVDRVRASGLPVELTVTGPGHPVGHPVPPGIDLAAYRVVQEALTNTMKHATGATATVIVSHTGTHLAIEVRDTGGPPSPRAATGNGHGLLGLRERMTLYDGTLHSGPTAEGGYRVTARIPLPPPETAITPEDGHAPGDPTRVNRS